jgi:hypothetical protein
VRRLRTAPRAPLAVAGILATPLFFVALMAMSLAVEKPSVQDVVKHGKLRTIFGDPAGATEAKIWLLAVVPSAVLVIIGTGAMVLGRAGVILSSLSAIALTVALLIPLDGWVKDHTARYPVGVDLIPPSAGSEDIYHRGEWEGTARHTAEQLGLATIAIAAAALAILVLLEVRRRRGLVPPPPPPPPALATGGVPRTGFWRQKAWPFGGTPQ